MISSALKKFALEKGMTVDHGAAYGEVDGYTVTLRDGLDVKTASFAVSLPDDESREQVLRTLTDPQRVRQYRLAAPVITPETISINFVDGSGMVDKIRSFLLWFPAVLDENRAVGNSACACCHQQLDEASSFVMADGIAMHLHPDCAAFLQAASPKADAPKKHLIRGILGAVLGVLIGMIPWAIITACDWSLVGWLGFVIAFLAKKGYELFGGKPSKAKFPILLISSVVGILLAQLIGQCAFLYLAFAEYGMSIDISSLPGVLFSVYGDTLAFYFQGGANITADAAWMYFTMPLINILVAAGLAALWVSGTPREARIEAEKQAVQGVLLLDGEPIPETDAEAAAETDVSEELQPDVSDPAPLDSADAEPEDPSAEA